MQQNQSGCTFFTLYCTSAIHELNNEIPSLLKGCVDKYLPYGLINTDPL